MDPMGIDVRKILGKSSKNMPQMVVVHGYPW